MESSLNKIEQLQLLLLKYNIQIFPLGVDNSQEKKKELIQILKEDQDFNDNLQTEVKQFLAIDSQLFKQFLGYERSFQIKKEHDNIEEYNNIQENILNAQNKIKDKQKDILVFLAFIHNNFIKDKDIVQLLEVALLQLNQLKAQAIQEISMLNKQNISEARAYKNPPPVLQKLFDMIDILLNKSSASSNIKTHHKILLASPNEFITKINQFNMQNISQNQITLARNLFESLNSDQCNDEFTFPYIMYNWGQYQFQIADILYTKQIEELTNHKKALQYQENIKDLKKQIQDLEKTVLDNEQYKHLLDEDSSDKAIEFKQTVDWFDMIQKITKPKEYGIKLTNYIIHFLQQQHPEAQIDVFIKEIMTNIFPTYTILYCETPELPYKYPIKLPNLTDQNINYQKIAHDIIILLKSPISLYNNLKQLNYLIDKAVLKQQIHSLVYQIYLNFYTYKEQLLQEILKLIHQSNILIPNETEFTLHPILEILNVNLKERKVIIGIIDHISKQSNTNILYQTQIQFHEKPLIDYLMKTYLDDNQSSLKINEQQLESIKNIIMKEKLNIDETLENINQNYQIILYCKEFYGEVNKQIYITNNKILDNKRQIVNLQEFIIQINQIFNKLKLRFFDVLTEIKYLQDQLKTLEDKDSQLLYQIDQQQKILNRPIHYGIKIKELGFLKYLNKFNPLFYFAIKIALIQLGIFSFTPDMIKKHLGSHSGLKKLQNLTINHLNDSQFLHLSNLLMDYNEDINVSQYHNKSIQNLIQRTFRIFQLIQLKITNNQLLVLRSDLLQKYRVIKKKLHILYNLKSELDSEVLSQSEEIIKQIQKKIELLQIQDKKNQSNVDQLNDSQQLQEFINKFQLIDTTDLCLQLLFQNFTNEQKEQAQVTKSEENYYLTYLRYQFLPKGLLKVQSKFYLLLMYLQDQYINNQEELLSIYEKKGFFQENEMPHLIIALSYQNYFNKIVQSNMNIIIGIYSYQLFYNEFGNQIQAICIQPEQNLTNHELNNNYQIRVLYEILCSKFGKVTLAVILQFLKQVNVIKSQIRSIYDILNFQFFIDAQNQIEFKEFQQEVQEILNCQIKEFVI